MWAFDQQNTVPNKYLNVMTVKYKNFEWEILHKLIIKLNKLHQLRDMYLK